MFVVGVLCDSGWQNLIQHWFVSGVEKNG